jgi:glycosyltransferase involved in cell wall biosynthesis
VASARVDAWFFGKSMFLSIVTPSFRNSKWLKLCIPSVADQQGVEFEHIVQDSCSDDGTQDWLPQDRRVKAFIEKDTGMYDGVNRGFRRAKGEIISYLNCDEQYLPGTLKMVHDYFETHPDIDILLPDTLVVDSQGEYICHRYSLVPLAHHLWVRFNVTTSSLFIRRRLLDELDLYFDTKWRDLGDVFWLMEAVRRGARFAELRAFASVFTETGENMNLKQNALREKRVKDGMTPPRVRLIRPIIIAHHRLRMLASGAFWQKPFSYSVYTLTDPSHRTTFEVSHPTPLWRGRY